MGHVAFRVVTMVAVVSALTAAAPAAAGDDWQWSITPYLWASDISETLIVDGAVVGGGDTEFNDLADMTDRSLQLHFEGIRDRWGFFVDLTYIELSDSQAGEMGYLNVDVELKEVTYEMGMIYRAGGESGRFDVLLGVRHLAIDERYRFQLGEGITLEPYVDEGYLDALVGARYHIPLADRWAISLKGDVSLGNTDYSWTAQGLVGWLFGSKRSHGVFVGYRYRDMKFTKKEVIEVEKTISGPVLGVKIGF
jgi:hypothetical protein